MPPPAPHFNHVAMSVPGDLLDEENRGNLTRFYSQVFGFEEMPTETIDRKRLVLGAGRVDQFLFLVGNDEPMTCPRLDHWGMSVTTEEQLDDYLDRAKKFREGGPARRHHRQARRRPPVPRAHLVLRRVPAPDDGRGAALELEGRVPRSAARPTPDAVTTRVSGGGATPRSRHLRRTARDPRSPTARPVRDRRSRTPRRTR